MRQLNIFETVKQSVSLRQAASFYGLRVRRDNKALCPFHPDRHPSMQLYDDHYYCFACGAHGDVIDLTAGLFHLQPADAVKKLAVDFAISSCDVHDAQLTENPASPEIDTFALSGKRLPTAGSAEESIHIRRRQTYFAFCEYRQFLLLWRDRLVPRPNEEFSDSYSVCCNELSRIEQYLDILQPGSLYSSDDIEALLKEKETEVSIIYEITRCCK